MFDNKESLQIKKTTDDKVLIVSTIFYCFEVILKFFPIDFPNIANIKFFVEIIYFFGMMIVVIKTEDVILKTYRNLLALFAMLLM